MCEDKIARLNLNITSKQAICINAETTLNTLSDPSEFKYVFALNAHDLNLSSNGNHGRFWGRKIHFSRSRYLCRKMFQIAYAHRRKNGFHKKLIRGTN